MATFVQTDLEVLLGEFNISTDHKAVALVLANDVQEDTRYGHAARTMLPGLNTWQANGEGYNDFEDNALDERLFGKIALADQLLTVAPLGATVAQVAYFGQAAKGEYTPVGDDVGDVLGFRWAAEGSGKDGMVRGTVMLNSPAITANGNGTAIQLGAVAAGQSVFMGLHFIGASGGNITATLESDNASGFPSPTVQLTAAVQSAPGHQFLSAAGAVADDWWRVAFTITAGTFNLVAVVGIQ